MLLGSAAEGIADWHSDLDLLTYHDTLPPAERVQAIVAGLDAAPLVIQAGQTTVADWEDRMERVLAEYKPDDPYHKVFAHYADAVPLRGAELVARWQARIAHYPDSWARPAVEHHLNVFPIWAAYDQVVARDATLWTYQMLVEGAQHVLGLLAGLNGVYWASFQFKRAHAFEVGLRWKPERLADRIDALFTADARDAAEGLEALVADTLDLIESHMPEVDASALRATIGRRHSAWGP